VDLAHDALTSMLYGLIIDILQAYALLALVVYNHISKQKKYTNVSD